MNFDGWLRAEGYAETTIVKLRRDIATMAEHGPTPPHAKSMQRLEAYRWAWLCWADYCESNGRINTLSEPPKQARTRRRSRRGDKRLNPAESITGKEWRRFLALVEADERIEARVIDVQCSTALRIGDVLRSSRAALEHGFSRDDGITMLEVKNAKPVVVSVRGGPEIEWRRLYTRLAELEPDDLVCQAVSPKSGRDWTAQGAAYRQVDRYLKKLGKLAKVSGRVHTHRIRRTVAVQAALAGVSKFKIQKMLNHYSSKTTDIYLDEAMAREVAEIAGKLRGRA